MGSDLNLCNCLRGNEIQLRRSVSPDAAHGQPVATSQPWTGGCRTQKQVLHPNTSRPAAVLQVSAPGGLERERTTLINWTAASSCRNWLNGSCACPSSACRERPVQRRPSAPSWLLILRTPRRQVGRDLSTGRISMLLRHYSACPAIPIVFARTVSDVSAAPQSVHAPPDPCASMAARPGFQQKQRRSAPPPMTVGRRPRPR